MLCFTWTQAWVHNFKDNIFHCPNLTVFDCSHVVWMNRITNNQPWSKKTLSSAFSALFFKRGSFSGFLIHFDRVTYLLHLIWDSSSTGAHVVSAVASLSLRAGQEFEPVDVESVPDGIVHILYWNHMSASASLHPQQHTLCWKGAGSSPRTQHNTQPSWWTEGERHTPTITTTTTTTPTITTQGFIIPEKANLFHCLLITHLKRILALTLVFIIIDSGWFAAIYLVIPFIYIYIYINLFKYIFLLFLFIICVFFQCTYLCFY